jgi:methionyl-tRNA synthetase
VIGDNVGTAEVLFARMDEAKKMLEVEAIKAKYTEPEPEKLELKEEITIDDFAKLDLRVAQIISAEKHPKADKLLVLQLQVGPEKRQVVSGISMFYKPEDLVGENVILVANLKPVMLRGVESQGMILAASTDDKLKLASVDMESGTVVS